MRLILGYVFSLAHGVGMEDLHLLQQSQQASNPGQYLLDSRLLESIQAYIDGVSSSDKSADDENGDGSLLQVLRLSASAMSLFEDEVSRSRSWRHWQKPIEELIGQRQQWLSMDRQSLLVQLKDEALWQKITKSSQAVHQFSGMSSGQGVDKKNAERDKQVSSDSREG